MGQVRHGSATTTHAVRAAIQRSQASLATLSRELGINPKTVAKWRKRQTVDDLKTGPKEPRSTVLTEAEEAAIVAFRRHTLLPLDDCLYALQPSIPHLTRSALHRCLQRHADGPSMLDRDPAPDVLRATLNAAQAQFDLCIIDTPPAAPEWLAEALGAADLVLIPVRPSPDDLRAVAPPQPTAIRNGVAPHSRCPYGPRRIFTVHRKTKC